MEAIKELQLAVAKLTDDKFKEYKEWILGIERVSPAPTEEQWKKGQWRVDNDRCNDYLIRFEKWEGDVAIVSEYYCLHGNKLIGFHTNYPIKRIAPLIVNSKACTPEKYSELILRIAEAKEYVKGTRVKGNDGETRVIDEIEAISGNCVKAQCKINFDWFNIYHEPTGTWAEIIKEEELPTREEELHGRSTPMSIQNSRHAYKMLTAYADICRERNPEKAREWGIRRLKSGELVVACQTESLLKFTKAEAEHSLKHFRTLWEQLYQVKGGQE
jgi:hypothetical protein